MPQNRPRTYIIGFDTERFPLTKLKELPGSIPLGCERKLYNDLNDLLDKDVEAKYYMASGYFETLIRHRARQEGKGYGFGYRIVNEPSIEHPIANTLLAIDTTSDSLDSKLRELPVDKQEYLRKTFDFMIEQALQSA